MSTNESEEKSSLPVKPPDSRPLRYRRFLTNAEKDKLAYELALGYFQHDELRHVMKVTPDGWAALMKSVEMKIRVLEFKRAIDESPDALRIHARRAARLAIDEYARIVQDSEMPVKVRMEAGRQLREYAMVADKDALSSQDDQGATIIKTNLDLKDATKGVYQIKARDLTEPTEEFLDLIGGDDEA